MHLDDRELADAQDLVEYAGFPTAARNWDLLKQPRAVDFSHVFTRD